MYLPVVGLLPVILLSSSALCAESQSLHRAKRVPLVWEVGATTTILTALAIPLDLDMPHTYVAINYAANYQNVQNGTWFTQPFNRFNQKNKRDLSSSSPLPSNPISRSSFYKTVIKELDKFGMDGKMCLLSTICAINSDPLDTHNGVLGSILQLLFSPSLSQPEYKLPKKFYEAELSGRQSNCDDYQAKCPLNILDLIAHIH